VVNTRATSDELKRIHLPQFEEIYAKVRSRVGRVIAKYKGSPGASPRRIALEILDTAYQVARDKLLSYRRLYLAVESSQELKTYALTVLGEDALKNLRVSANLHSRLRNLWLTLRRELEYSPEEGREINQALRQVSRLVSYVKRKRRILEGALELKKELSFLPGLPDIPRIVIAGPPNAGKSSLANAVSKTKTKVADYPFTTKAIEPGVLRKTVAGLAVTVLDTPGLLLRGPEKMKPIERRALAAIKLPKTIVVFVVDPFSNVMSLEDQLKLLAYVASLNPNLLVAVNKADIDRTAAESALDRVRREGYEAVLVSALTGEGVDSLLEKLSRAVEAAAGLGRA